MRAVNSLPDGYKEYYSIDLHKSKKMSLVVNLIAVIIGVAMVVPVLYLIPFSTLFDISDGDVFYFMRFAVWLVSQIVYIVLHELVHGMAMKICGTKKVKYGLKGLYAFAGSEDYYDKKAYIFIALAPVVLWGVVLAVINCFVPTNWFWVVYIIQITNISGAAGDLYVTIKFSRFPKDILVKDYGVGMTVYSNEV